MRHLHAIMIGLFLVISFTPSTAQDIDRQRVINPYSSYLKAEAIDINGDGLMDVNGNPLYGFEAHLNLGDNTYSSVDYFELPVSHASKNSDNFFFFDRDADGDKDIIYVPCPGCGDNSLRFFENVGQGKFEDRGKVLDRFGGFSSPSFTAHDFDGDGDEDFIFIHNKSIKYGISTPDSIEIVEIHHAGNFTSGFSDVYDFDITMDGKHDVIVQGVRSGKSRLLILHNTGDGFEFVEEVTGGDYYSHLRDVNGDGVTDFYYQKDDCVVVLPAENGSFGSEYSFYCGSREDGWYFLMDYDVDGDLDVFHGQLRKKGLYLVENDSSNFLPARKISTTGQQIIWIEEIDANGDEFPDLIIDADADNWMLGVVENESWFTHIVTTGLYEDEFQIVQADQDAHKEIFVFGDNWMGIVDPNESIYPGLRTFYNSSRGIDDANFVDWDKDGDQDIILYYFRSVTSEKDLSVVLLEKEGQSYLPAQGLIFDLTSSGDLVIEDFNNDGFMDLLLNGRYLYINDGNGAVTHEKTVAKETGGVHVADINGDGWKDLLTWYYFYEKPRYYENDKNGGFESSVEIGGTEGRVNNIDANDIDRDGDLDLIIFYSDSTCVFENTSDEFIQRFSVEGYWGNSRIINSQLDLGNGFLTGSGSTYFANAGNFNFEQGTSVEENLYTQMLTDDLDGNGHTDMVALEDKDDFEGLYIQKDLVRWLDKDGDNFSGVIDCNDSLSSIHPEAMEIPNNGIDENCDGEDGTTVAGAPLNFELEIYPNPTSDKVFFTFPPEYDVLVSLFEPSGKLIIQKQNPKFLNLTGVSPNLYYLIVEDKVSGGSIAKRIVVQ